MNWEYETYSWNSAYSFGKEDLLIKALNRLGKDGWEVVSAIPTKFRGGDITEQTDEVIFVLKRPCE